MALGEILSLAMFAGTMAVLMLGFPVAFSLAGSAVGFAALGDLLGVFDWRLLGGMTHRIYGTMTNETLVAVPLFIFMGVMLERSKVAERLLETAGRLFGSMGGGLAIAAVVVGALLAAATGIVGATVTTMGLISLPAMLRARYDTALAGGVICASSTLSQIIPPSTVLILIGDLLRGANAEAHMNAGNFIYEPVTVVDLFAGALIPGLMLVGIFVLWVVFVATVSPNRCPPVAPDPQRGSGVALALDALRVLLPPVLLIVAVLGSILAGVATPTESSAVGAVGATGLAVMHGVFSRSLLQEVATTTMRITTMVFLILLGASFFTLVFRGLGGNEVANDLLNAMPGGIVGAVFVVLAIMFFLGFFIDSFEIIFIVVPIAAPILIGLGADPVWLGVLMGMILQTSYLTPPFGFSIFFLQGVFRDLRVEVLYRGVIPFVVLQLIGIGIVCNWPELATWLPKVLFPVPGG